MGLGCRVLGVGAKGATITSSAALLVVVVAAIKFPVHLEKAWLLASMLGFALDVGVYHTFSLFVRSVMKLLVGGRASARVSMHAGSSPWGLTASVCHVSVFRAGLCDNRCLACALLFFLRSSGRRFFPLICRSHSISFTRAQGIPLGRSLCYACVLVSVD